ncbi:MAG: sigma 54-interacting transcriptional regulator [Candidatus Saccharibacteria bacterium]
MKFRSIMIAAPVVFKRSQTVAATAEQLLLHDVEDAPVLDAKGKFLGMVSQSALLKALTSGLSPQTTIDELAAYDCHTASPDDNIRDFANYSGGSLPILENGELLGIITRPELLKAFQRKWLEDRNELVAIGNAIYNPLISVDKSGKIRRFNKSLEKMLGLDPHEIIRHDIMDFFPTSKLPDVMKTGELQLTQKIFFKDKVYLSNRSPIIENGIIIGAVAVLQDVSQLEAISEELAYTKHLAYELDAIIDSSFDGLYVTDGKGNTLRINKGFERIMGIPAEECLGRNMADLVREGVYSRSGTLLALERRERVTITLQARTGKWALVTSNPIFDENGEITLVVTNVRDITELNDLQRKLEQAEGLSKFYQTELQKLQSTRKVVFRSPVMNELINMVIRVAGVDSTVLIQGESGAGKELIADIIHANSPHKNGPFVKVNCGAIPDNLLESELFGYEPGAFTGASKTGKAGLFELANNGTIFLDEIAEMPLNLQVKLLRVIQDREITRVGGTSSIPVNLRIIAGTNRDLERMVFSKQFREDLYYRLNVVPIYVPPLRQRRDDIPALAWHFLEFFNDKYRMDKRLATDVLNCFLEYSWPGNVRELENLIERLVVTSLENVITPDALPASLKKGDPQQSETAEIIPLKDAVENTERQLLKNAFSQYKSSYQVARVLKVNQSTIVRKAAKYGIKLSNS